MKLQQEFYQLPLLFDGAQLAEEISVFTEADWRPHPEGHKGNSALPLIALNGDVENDGVKGINRPTKHLEKCPYLQQILSELQAVWGRTRLMRIAGGAEATMHFDTNYYWMQRVRVHIPIITFPEVTFICGEKSVHMGDGETWIFDTWKLHNVINPTPYERIHLVADTVGSGAFWDLVEQSEKPPIFLPYKPNKPAKILTETVNFPVVMSPWEQLEMIDLILSDLPQVELNDREDREHLGKILSRFQQEWRALWARYGASLDGESDYRQALRSLEQKIQPLKGKLRLPNNADAVDIVKRGMIIPALNYDLATDFGKEKLPPVSSPHPKTNSRPQTNTEAHLLPESLPELRVVSSPQSPPRFERPIFIVAAPRSGSTLLFETLSQSPRVLTVGGESHKVFEEIPQLTPAHQDFASNRLTARNVNVEIAQQVKSNFLKELRNREGHPLPSNAESFRLLEKTPKNALRIPFLNAIFPDALFIYLYREPQENISSILEAWKSGKFVTYPRLPGWQGLPWSLLLIPEWKQLENKELIEIAATQWMSANSYILDDLSAISKERWCAVSYSDLVKNPQAVVTRLCDFAGIEWDHKLDKDLPLSRHTLTPPAPDKWRKNEALLKEVLPIVEPIEQRARSLIAEFSPIEQKIDSNNNKAEINLSNLLPKNDNKMNDYSKKPNDNKDLSPLRSVYTSTLPELLKQNNLSFVVSTYQAGKLIVVREDQGSINTHFQFFQKPMGIAGDNSRLAVGGKNMVVEFRNIPAVAKKMEPIGKHDACYLPRYTHFTGDIDIHEMAWAKDELWIVNTRFSCLCTLDTNYSFVPRWKPKFIDAFLPEDRCHLNGLAVVSGMPKYVTALGKSNTARGWRENKANGGVLIEVQNNEIIAQGLSMPHSPRWYRNQLWFLESGKGSLATVDINSGEVETVIELPGFTRGLDFYGPFAFIGLSQVRETAAFGEIPITEKLQERNSGVWVVNIQTGKMVAFLKFEDMIQETFAVQVLAGIHFPEITQDDENLLSSSYVLPEGALQR